jgi:cytidine deaminase
VSEARVDALVAELRTRAPLEGVACAHTAVVAGADGAVHTGRTIRCIAPGLGACATRIALARRIASGPASPPGLVVAVGTSDPPALCGLCRQSLVELAPEAVVYLASDEGPARRVTRLMPRAFRPEHIEGDL